MRTRNCTIKRLKFRAHFNRVNMRRGNPNVWTVHNSRGCFQGQAIHSYVSMRTIFKKDGRQPRAYFEGYAHVRILGGILVLE
jgi:hypothetical protein